MVVTLGVVPVIVAIPLFRLMFRDGKMWASTALLLLLQPEFILVTSRGTHEKATITLVIVILMLIVKHMLDRNRDPLRIPTSTTIILATLIPTLVFLNCFFAFMFFVAITIAFVIIGRKTRTVDAHKLLFFPAYGFLIFALFLVLYNPAASLIETAATFWDRLVLIMSGEVSPESPYAPVGTAWTSGIAWAVTNLLTFFLIASSAAYAISSFLKKLKNPVDMTIVPIYIGASTILLAGIILDLIGGSGIANLQLRWLPFWTIFAAPLAVTFLSRGRWHPARGIRMVNPGRLIVVSLVIVTVIPVCLMRATLDPSISNNYIFYSDTEETLVDWAAENLEGECWGGLHYRIGSIFVFKHGYPQSANLKFMTAENPYEMDAAIDTALDRDLAGRMGLPAITLSSWNKINDGGTAAIYQSIPDVDSQLD
jgi:hypothetical protein